MILGFLGFRCNDVLLVAFVVAYDFLWNWRAVLSLLDVCDQQLVNLVGSHDSFEICMILSNRP